MIGMAETKKERKPRKKEVAKPELGLTKKGKPRKREYPEGVKGHKTSTTFGELVNMEAGDNSRYTSHSLEIASLPPIDLNDPTAVWARIQDYFHIVVKNDMKPTLAGVSMALGMDRGRFYDWAFGTGRIASPQREMAQKVYQILNSSWEDYMLNGKVNPASGIFIGKNNFGYSDEQKLTVTNSNDSLRDGRTDDELRAIYDLPIETDGEVID